MCLSPIWTVKHETAKRLAQRIMVVLDVAKAKGFRSGENPVTAVRQVRSQEAVAAERDLKSILATGEKRRCLREQKIDMMKSSVAMI